MAALCVRQESLQKSSFSSYYLITVVLTDENVESWFALPSGKAALIFERLYGILKHLEEEVFVFVRIELLQFYSSYLLLFPYIVLCGMCLMCQ